MIYLRLQGKMEDIIAQVVYAEHLSKLYNQPVSLYINGSYKNHKKYYEEILAHCGLFDKYPFVETYPSEIPVIFEHTENSEERIAERGQQGLDIVIEGDFYFYVDIDIERAIEIFSPSNELVEYMNERYSPTKDTLYIDLTPGDIFCKNEFAVAELILEKIMPKFQGKNFDKVIVKSNYFDFFQTGNIEEIVGNNNIMYVGEEPEERFAESAKVMLPYMCGNCIISNNLESWWGTIFNPFKDKQIDLVFGTGKIKRYEEFPYNGITNELISERMLDVAHFSIEEMGKKLNGEPSAFDNILFEYEISEK